jgi:hypothetical protein
VPLPRIERPNTLSQGFSQESEQVAFSLTFVVERLCGPGPERLYGESDALARIPVGRGPAHCWNTGWDSGLAR